MQQKFLMMNTVRVVSRFDEGTVRVEYESPDNVYGDQVVLEYKKPLPDEEIQDLQQNFIQQSLVQLQEQQILMILKQKLMRIGGNIIEDLDSDVSKLKEFATGQKPTMKEIVQAEKRKIKKRITE